MQISLYDPRVYIPTLIAVGIGFLCYIYVIRNKDTSAKPKRTGVGTTIMRAMAMYESVPKLQCDYLASSFLPLPLRLMIKSKFLRNQMKKKMPGVYTFILARTVFFDQIWKEQLDNVQQIVNMGAGFDSRALRFEKELTSKGITVFELDLPPFSSLKKQKLQQIHESKAVPDHLKLIPIDFSQQTLQEVLQSTIGFDSKKKTLFIWEGVACYLPPSAVDSTLHFITSNSAPESVLAWDYNFEDMKTNPSKYYQAQEALRYSSQLKEPFLFGLNPNEVDDFASSRGLKVIKHFCGEKDICDLIGDSDWTSQHKTFDFIGFVAMAVL